MSPAEALLDAFIDANILICVAFVIWLGIRALTSRLGLQHAHGMHLRLLNIGFLAVVFAPLVVVSWGALQRSGVATSLNPNLSDLVVSHYLNGGIEMTASQFQGLITLRDSVMLDLLNGAGLMAQVAIAGFLAGAVYGLVRLAHSIICLRSIVAHSYAWRNFGRVRIRLSETMHVPFSTRGVRNYYVVLPSHMLGHPHELKVSLAHELQHIRQGDLEWEVILEALKPLFFLNPVYHVWKRQVESLRELNCDSRVLARGRVDARAYCDTLLSVCQTALRCDRSFEVAVPKVTLLTADRSILRKPKKSFLERRIMSVLNARQLAYQKVAALAIAVPLVAAVAFATLAIQRPSDWSHDRIMLSTVVNLERLDEINRLSTFGRVRD